MQPIFHFANRGNLHEHPVRKRTVLTHLNTTEAVTLGGTSDTHQLDGKMKSSDSNNPQYKDLKSVKDIFS